MNKNVILFRETNLRSVRNVSVTFRFFCIKTLSFKNGEYQVRGECY